MRGFLEDYGGDVLTGLTAIVVAVITVLAAEGGRDRRTLKRLKEEFEVYELAQKEAEFQLLAIALRYDIRERGDRYVTRGARRQRLGDRVWQAAFLAGFLYALFDFWRAVAQGTDITTVGFLLVALYLALAVVAVVVGLVLAVRTAVTWLWSRRH